MLDKKWLSKWYVKAGILIVAIGIVASSAVVILAVALVIIIASIRL